MFLGVLLFSVAIALSGGQFFEHGSDPSFVAVLKGVFTTSHPRLSNNDGNWILIQYIFRSFYTYYPDQDWYGITLIFAFSLSTFILLKIIATPLNKVKNNTLQTILFVILLIMMFENFALLEFTRIAILSSFFGLLLIVTEIKRSGDNEKVNIPRMALGLSSFILGGLIRYQSAMLSFSVVLPLTIVYLYRGYFSLRQLFTYLSWPILFLFLCTTYVGIRWDRAWDKTPDYGGYLISLWDVHSTKKNLKLDSQADSLMYHVVADLHFVNDPKNLNPVFFEKIKVPYTDKKIESIPELLFNKIDYTSKFNEQAYFYMSKHWGWVLLLFCIAFLATFFSTDLGRISHRWDTIILFIYYSGLYIAIAIFLKMEERLFCPLFLSFCVIFTLLAKQVNYKSYKFVLLHFIVLVLSIIALRIEFRDFKKQFSARKNEVLYIKEIFQYIGSRNEKYIFIDQLSDQIYLSPMQKDPLLKDKFYLSIDNYCFFLCPTYHEKMKLITGGNDVCDYLRFCRANSTDCIMISERKRLDEIITYFNYMYDLNLKYKPVGIDLLEIHQGNKSGLDSLQAFKIVS